MEQYPIKEEHIKKGKYYYFTNGNCFKVKNITNKYVTGSEEQPGNIFYKEKSRMKKETFFRLINAWFCDASTEQQQKFIETSEQ